jgi:hypothetical protein
MNESISPQIVSSPNPFNERLFEIIEPWLKGRVLEIDSTPDSISTVFIQKGLPIHLSTSDKTMRAQLKTLYQGMENARHVHSINFHRVDFEQAYLEEKVKIFDTVLALNKHCDFRMAYNARQVLKERGRLILLAPAYTAMYHGLQEDLDDWKRYNRQSINKLLTDDMEILLTRFFNVDGLSVLAVARKQNLQIET